jgi:hypothetical protein
MARTTSRTRSVARKAVAAPVSPRNVFLAGIGAVIVGRRQAERLVADAATVPQRVRAGADAAVSTARLEANKLAKVAKTRIAPLRREADKLGAQMDSARKQGLAEAAKRLNPLLTRVGLPTITVARAARKTKAAATRRPAAKKVVKAVRRRA